MTRTLSPAETKTSLAHARPSPQPPFVPPTQKLASRARRRPSPPPPSLVPSPPRHGIPVVPRGPPQRLSDLLSVILFITCNHEGNSLQKRVAEGGENLLKTVQVGLQSICTPFHIPGAKAAFSEQVTGGYDTKSATCRTLEVTCLGLRRSDVALPGGRNSAGSRRAPGRFRIRREPLPLAFDQNLR